MTAPGLAPGVMPGRSRAKTFAGTMTLSTRSGFELPFPEFTRSDGSAQFALPEIADDRYFSLHIQGADEALNVKWFDSRYIGTPDSPAIGTGTRSGNHVVATILYGNYTVQVDGTIAGESFAGTITTSIGTVVEAHTCLVLNAAPPTFKQYQFFSSTGDDAKDGKTLITPKRTLPTPQDGGAYKITRGSIFSGANDHLLAQYTEFEATDCGIGHYFVGNQCDVLAGWVDATGGAWSTQFTAQCVITQAGGQTQVIENGFPLQRMDSLAACQGKAGSFYPTTMIGTTPTTMTVYVHATDGGNPNTNGKIYEATVREAFLAGAGSSYFDGFHARGATCNSGPASHISRSPLGTDAARSRNFVVSHGVYHNHYMASGVMEKGLSLFCQVQSQGGNNSHWVFHRWATDTVPTGWTQINCAIIESPYRARSSNETGYDWHPSGAQSVPLGNITINQAYATHVGGFLFFPSGASGVTTVNDLLVERMSGTGS